MGKHEDVGLNYNRSESSTYIGCKFNFIISFDERLKRRKKIK